MNEQLILHALRNGFVEDDPRSGLTPLDRLIQTVQFDAGAREQTVELLTAVVPHLRTASDWQALDLLVSQGGVKSQLAGEVADNRLASGELEQAAWIWAARSAISLGSVLSRDALARLANAPVRETNPEEWIAVLSDACEWNSVSRAFETAADGVQFSAQQAFDLLREFKKAAVQAGAEWNNSVTWFLESLPQAVAAEVAQRAEPIIGHTYLQRAEARANVAIPDAFVVMEHVQLPNDFSLLFEGIEIVRENTDWSYHQAMLPERIAA